MTARRGFFSPSAPRRRGLLALLLALAAAADLWLAGARAQFVDDPNVLPTGQGPLFASVGQIFAAMERWAAASPRYLSVYRATDPETGQSFPVARFTDHSLPRPSGQPPRRRVLVTCAVHARELVAAEVCLHALRLLAGTPADRAPVLAWRETAAALVRAGVLDRRRSPAALPGSDAVATFASSFSQRYELHVAPLVNIDGRLLIENSGKYNLRKTVPDGVDINRNFHVAWSPAAGAPASQTYPGPFPASQWETRAMAALLAKVRPHAYTDVHSGIHALLTPLCSTCSQLGVDPSHLAPLQDAADRAVRAVGNFTNGPAAALLYTALGTAADFAYGGLGVGPSATLEVYGTGLGGTGLGVVCPRLAEWWAKCRRPAAEDDAASGCAGECGSDPALACKRQMGFVPPRTLLSSTLSSSSSSPSLGGRGGRDAAASAEAGGNATGASASPLSTSSSASSPSSLPFSFTQRAVPADAAVDIEVVAADAADNAAAADDRISLRVRAQLAAVARRRGASPELARWQAAAAEATAEDVGLFMPDGELLWFEWEKEQQEAASALRGGGGGTGGGGGGGAAAGGPVPPNLRHLRGAALDAALGRRDQLRATLWGQLERIAGGSPPLPMGVADVSSSSSPWAGGAAAAAAVGPAAAAAPDAAPPPNPAWFAQDPYLRHWGETGTPTQNPLRTTLLTFNPTDPGAFRRVVSDFAAVLIAYGAAASGGALVG